MERREHLRYEQHQTEKKKGSDIDEACLTLRRTSDIEADSSTRGEGGGAGPRLRIVNPKVIVAICHLSFFVIFVFFNSFTNMILHVTSERGGGGRM